MRKSSVQLLMASITLRTTRTRAGRPSISPFLPPSLTSYILPLLDGYTKSSRAQTRQRQRPLHTQTGSPLSNNLLKHSELLNLPTSCPGCGAFTQLLSPDQPGFYSSNRKSVKAFLAQYEQSPGDGRSAESEMFEKALSSADSALLTQIGLGDTDTWKSKPSGPKSLIPPICNRCHALTHHNTGTPIIHPTVESIYEIISESPYKYNHIYHVLDAADFPLSLIPSLQRHLWLSPQRSLNRRAQTGHFQHGRKAEMSFIITRSDLLAPRKEQVDSLMPYIVQVLRDALGGSAENVRLGNVRCVSSKRGWWTTQVKEDIWTRGGGGWMVGKVNVGKSNLFENVFPKGRTEDISFEALRHAALQASKDGPKSDAEGLASTSTHEIKSEGSRLPSAFEERTQLLQDSPLPPAARETPYPVLPIVSSLPGTTASPIRLPYGSGKGELVDLPGLSRGDLEEFVVDGHKPGLVMRHRVKPEQFTIKPGQSLVVGGLVRITPTTADLTFLAYPFVPIECHVTSTEKAILVHSQKGDSGVPTIAKSGIGSRMDPAGTFPLKWDVTKQRAGPLTRKDAAGLNAEVLPFQVFSIDVLIEGCGWVELVAQVRKKSMKSASQIGDLFDTKPYPSVQIFSPDGRHIGIRQPMGAWSLFSQKPGSSSSKIVRARRSMKGVKKELKKSRRRDI